MYESPIRVPILAVDPGARSGWALFEPIGPAGPTCWKVTTGACSPWGPDVEKAVALAHQFPGCSLVIEKAAMNGGGKFINMVMGLAQTAGIWRYEWLRAHAWARTPELSVVPQSWRAGVLGGGTSSRDTDSWKRASKEHFRGCLMGSDAFFGGSCDTTDAEQADAFGLGWWALHSPALADELGVRRLAAAGWDDRAACLAAKAIRGKTEGGDDE